MKCNICGGSRKEIFEGKILNKFKAGYYFCPNCESLQIKDPFWLEEAYADPIALEDTGILRRNLDNAITVTSVICSFYDTAAKFFDYAGGYGLFTRLMRDIGFDFRWDDKYTKNLFARGFEYNQNDIIELACGFEVMEHVKNPVETLDEIFKTAPDFLFSQTCLPLPVPKQENWWYYAPASGQHINFYTNKTLNILAQKFNKKYIHCHDFHLFTKKNITENEFINVILNDAKIYAGNISKLKSKIGPDMNYIIKSRSKSPG